MGQKEKEFLKKLQVIFLSEAREHLAVLKEGMIQLEKTDLEAEKIEIVDRLLREAHSLKGAARSVNRKEIEELCQSLEAEFAGLKKNEISPVPQWFDQIHELLKKAEKMAVSSESGEIASGKISGEKSASGFLQPSQSETVRISAEKLESLFLRIEEMLSVKLSAQYHLSLVEKLEKRLEEIPSIGKEVSSLKVKLKQDLMSLNGVLEPLFEEARSMLISPFSSLLESFPSLARDLAREEGKKVQLVIQGGDIEIDRRILQEMKDPFLHLLRNAIDHGIEKPDLRLKKGKPLEGEIRIAISRKDSGKIEILFSDDGEGVDLKKVKEKAVSQGVVAKQEAESDEESLNLIFQPDISTRAEISSISGRGVGLAVVKEKVQKLGGMIKVETRPDQGTTFRIVLPMTLAAFRGVILNSGDRLFAVPSLSVEKAVRVGKSEIKTIENQEYMVVKNQMVPVAPLSRILEIPEQGNGNSHDLSLILILSDGNKMAGFKIKEILREEEILVKNLSYPLLRVRNISGLTILGDGGQVPILNPEDLICSALRLPAMPVDQARKTFKSAEKKVLIVDDSITARTFLKNILETAGYLVETAVNGIAALSLLNLEAFDLVVSDVDMPEMNGLDLTAKIRTDDKLLDLPVVLVSALDSREDREKGMKAGANVYFSKNSLEQGNLLEIIEKLIE